MKNRFVAIVIASLFASAAVGSSHDIAAKSAFNAIVDRCKAAYERLADERPGASSSLGHSIVRAAGLSTSYDIRRTDSLVSPYLATLEQRVTTESTAFFPTAEQANGARGFVPRLRSTHSFLFAFQEDAWVFRSMSTTTQFIKDGVPGKPSRVDDKPDKFADGSPKPSFVCAHGKLIGS